MRLISLQYEPIVRAALIEDVGAGDITTESCIPAEARSTAVLLAKSPGIVAGLALAECAFHILDPLAEWEPLVEDGYRVEGGRVPLARVSGQSRALLTAERVALNLMQRISGVATITARFVSLVEGTAATIVDTRKTTPGLRSLEKYGVRVGGGKNHRIGLYDSVLIKDNHIKASGSIGLAVAAARRNTGHTVKIEVEASTLEQVAQAVEAQADIILLDNMNYDQLRESVALVKGRAVTEASGGITEQTVRLVAETGVNVISVGALTHSAPAMDISLDFND